MDKTEKQRLYQSGTRSGMMEIHKSRAADSRWYIKKKSWNFIYDIVVLFEKQHFLAVLSDDLPLWRSHI